MAEIDYIFSLTINGDENVGKYSFRKAYMGSYVSESTYGCYSGTPIYKITPGGYDAGFPYIQDIEGKMVNLFVKNIYDSAKFKQTSEGLKRSYYKNTLGAFVLFDYSNKVSFDNLKWWLDNIATHSKNEHIHIFIIGNKSDLPKTVLKSEIKDLIDITSHRISNGLVKFMETNCKTGDGIEEAYNLMVSHCIETLNSKK